MMDNSQWRVKQPEVEERNVCLDCSDPVGVWREVMAKDRVQITELFAEMKRVVTKKLSWPLFCFLARFFYPHISKQNKRYIEECKYFARETGVFTPVQMMFIQVQTTIATYFSGGCSTVAVWDEKLQQMICMRSLDWKCADMVARCSRIFNLHNESGRLLGKVSGISGMVGCLTAVREGFAIVGNYAPGRPKEMPWNAVKKNDASFLLRMLMEDESITTYKQAVDSVQKWDVAAPGFITICGVKKGEATVIEFGRNGKYSQRTADECGLLVQTNHYGRESPFVGQNKEFCIESKMESLDDWYCSSPLKNSGKRYEMLEEKLKNGNAGGEDLEKQLEDIFAIPPVMNQETAQWVLMKPADGIMKVTAFPEGEKC